MEGPSGHSVTVIVVFTMLITTSAPVPVRAISSKVSWASSSIPLPTSSQSSLSSSLQRLSNTFTQTSSRKSSITSLPTSPVTSSTSLAFCDFETAGLCGWTPIPSSGYSFRRHQGFTADRTSGPDSDHTLKGPQRGGSRGHYVYSSGWDATGPGQTACLLSPPFTLTNPAHLSFWYHMNGKGVGSLTVTLRPLRSEGPAEVRPLTVWRVAGRQGRHWHCTHLPLPPGHWQVEFSSTVKHAYGSDIALDDIAITPMDPVDTETTMDLPTAITAESGKSTQKPSTRSSNTYTLHSTTLGHLNECVSSTTSPSDKIPTSKQTPRSSDSTSLSRVTVPSSPHTSGGTSKSLTYGPSSALTSSVVTSMSAVTTTPQHTGRPTHTRASLTQGPSSVQTSPATTSFSAVTTTPQHAGTHTRASLTYGPSSVRTSLVVTSFSAVTTTPLSVSTHTRAMPSSRTRITPASTSVSTSSDRKTTPSSKRRTTATSAIVTVSSTSSVATPTRVFKPTPDHEHPTPQTQPLSTTTTTPPKNRTMATASNASGAGLSASEKTLLIAGSVGLLLVVLVVGAVCEYRQTAARQGGAAPVGGLKEVALQSVHQQEEKQSVHNGQLTTLSTTVQIRL